MPEVEVRREAPGVGFERTISLFLYLHAPTSIVVVSQEITHIDEHASVADKDDRVC